MPMVRAMRMLNAVEAGTLTGAQLQTLLAADPGRLAELNVLLGMRGQARRMAASSTAMAAVAASSTAMAAVAASSTAMAAMAASSTAMAAMAASSTAKMSIFNSDAALNAIKRSAVAMAALREAAQYSVVSNTAGVPPVTLPGLNAAGSYIMLGYSKNNTGSQGIAALATLRSGTTQPASYAAITNPASTAGADVNIATPLVAPFTVTHTNIFGNVWYYGLLRCDV